MNQSVGLMGGDLLPEVGMGWREAVRLAGGRVRSGGGVGDSGGGMTGVPYHAGVVSIFHPKRGLFAGALIGGPIGVWVFGMHCAMSLLPDVGPASLSHAFQPWWRQSNWMVALVVGLFFGLPVGVIEAFRPVLAARPRLAPRTSMQKLGRFLQGFFVGALLLPIAAGPITIGVALAFPDAVARWQIFAVLGAGAVLCGLLAMRWK